MARHLSKLAVSTGVCGGLLAIIHFSWMAGYTANPAHPMHTSAWLWAVATKLWANVDRWKKWLVPVFTLVFVNAFKDLLTDWGKRVILRGWSLLKRATAPASTRGPWHGSSRHGRRPGPRKH